MKSAMSENEKRVTVEKMFTASELFFQVLWEKTPANG